MFVKVFSVYIEERKAKTLVVEMGLLKSIAIITFFAIILETGNSILSLGLDSVYRTMRYKIGYGEEVNFYSKYLPVLYNTVFISWIMELIKKNEIKKEKINVTLYSVIFFVIAFFSFSRTGLIMAFCAFGYCMLQNNKANVLNVQKIFSKIFFIVLSIAFLVYLFSWIANATNKMGDDNFWSPNNFIWKYLGYPLVIMDKYVITNPGFYSGRISLGVFGDLLNRLDLYRYNNATVIPDGVFNVYSYIGCAYLDFGLGSFFEQLFIAMFVAYVYVKNKKCGGKWTVFYAFYLYAIIISFYSFQYSLTLYVYIFFLLIFLEKRTLRFCLR